jgi:hypothetical protein
MLEDISDTDRKMCVILSCWWFTLDNHFVTLVRNIARKYDRENRTEYQVTNSIIRSAHKLTRYTAMHIRYNTPKKTGIQIQFHPVGTDKPAYTVYSNLKETSQRCLTERK